MWRGGGAGPLESSTGVCHSSASVLPLILWTPSKPAEQPPRWMPSPFGACGDGHSSVACPVIGPFLKTGPAALRAVFTECRTNGRPFGAYRDCRAEEAFAYLWGLPGRSCRWRRCCWKIIDSLGATVFALRADRAFGSGTEENRKKELLMKRILMLGLLALSLLCGTAFAKTGEGMTIWFDTGGSVGDGYGTIVQNGAKAAAADMGCELRLLYSDWNPETMITAIFRQCRGRTSGRYRRHGASRRRRIRPAGRCCGQAGGSS